MREIWAVDFEFIGPPGERPTPVCCVAREMISGRRVRLWGPEMRRCPFEPRDDVLVVTFYGSAEIACFLQLGWPLPTRHLDLYAEFSAITNGRERPFGRSLLAALAHYDLSRIAPAEKAALRQRIMAGPPYSDAERIDILDYCESDVTATAALLAAVEPIIASSPVRFNQALMRGRYVTAVAHMENRGIPIDVPLWCSLQEHWEAISRFLIAETDGARGIFGGGSFKAAKFQAWCEARRIPWPALASGMPDLKQGTFSDMAEIFPEVEPIKQLRVSLADLRKCGLTIGRDGRNRALLSPFKTKTGRNAPSSTRYIFGASSWLRHLIKPESGTALAYLDFTAQEIAIAAALSSDERLLEAALSGDPYLAFAKQAGLVPPDATKETHEETRQRVKAMVLGSGYGMEAPGLAFRLQIAVAEASLLLRAHAEAYPAFTQWRFDNLNRALLGLPLSTAFGWPFHVGPDVKPNTLKNWPIQSCGADMLRLACSLGIERGVAICAPVHDAVLIEAPLPHIDEAVAVMREAMQEASRIILNGVTIGVDSKVVRFPDRFEQKRGAAMFQQVLSILARLEKESVQGVRIRHA